MAEFWLYVEPKKVANREIGEAANLWHVAFMYVNISCSIPVFV